MPSERLLSILLRDLAHTLVTDFSIQHVLDHLVERIVDILPVTGAGVTVISPGADPHYTAASDDSALHFVELQTQLGEGPGRATYETGLPVTIADLASETRFPAFVPRARAAGLAAVFTFPLRNGDERLGALDLYCRNTGPLSPAATEAAQTLADVAASYLLNAQARVDVRESSVKTQKLALHDALTGLPNRVLLLERLDHAVLRGRRSGRMAAILFVDLDRFKRINDLYGHRVGDELLLAVAQRLRLVVRPGDTLARVSGNEFVVLCEDLDGATRPDVQPQVDDIAARIGAAIADPFELGDAEVQVTASVGIAFTGRGSQVSEHLLNDADTAMSQAKSRGGARHQIIDLREQHLADERTNLEHDLRGASTRGELRTEYQPIVETTSGRIAGVEALLRWAHPSRGLVAPAVLVPLAERSGLITEIGRWVLEQTCSDGQEWEHPDAVGGLSMSVNVSAHQLMSPAYVRTVAGVLAASGTDPSRVTLEVTESVFVQDSERARAVLGELKQLGVKLALDDFGTGYSSLNYLKRFPIDSVKIDQTFVADLANDHASHAIVSAVVELAHMLGMTVVAEGVETAEQHQLLGSLGCDSCQGFYFARPISAGALDTLMMRQVDGKGARLPALASASYTQR